MNNKQTNKSDNTSKKRVKESHNGSNTSQKRVKSTQKCAGQASNLLSIETSGKICSISLSTVVGEDLETTCEYNISGLNKHDRYAAELCRRILSDNGLNVYDLDAVIVSAGPGSFTGLRIGFAIAKGLCFRDVIIDKKGIFNDIQGNFKDKKDNFLHIRPRLITVPTLRALANNAINYIKHIIMLYNNDLKLLEAGFNVLSIVPSHGNYVYYELFHSNDELISDCIDINNAYYSKNIGFCTLSSLKREFSEYKNLFITSNQYISPGFGYVLPSLMCISSSTVALLGAKMYFKHIFVDVSEAVPLYIQEFVPKKHI